MNKLEYLLIDTNNTIYARMLSISIDAAAAGFRKHRGGLGFKGWRVQPANLDDFIAKFGKHYSRYIKFNK